MLKFHYLISFATMYHFLGINVRAINNTGTWFLPKVTFPMFYRYFKDKATWDGANNICNAHRSKLVSLNDDEKLEVLRGFLEKLDVVDYIWIGLKKDSLDEPFFWINGERVIGDGFWLLPIPKSVSRLCALTDPTANFRWLSFYCGGPQKAAFVCELKVPNWAKNGCITNDLSSVSITLEPEKKVIELTSDCDIAGTKRIVCKGKTNRKALMKHLTCNNYKFTKMTVTDKTTFSKRKGATQTTKGWTWTSAERLTRHRRSLVP